MLVFHIDFGELFELDIILTTNHLGILLLVKIINHVIDLFSSKLMSQHHKTKETKGKEKESKKNFIR